MGKKKNLSVEIREKIILLKKENRSFQEIANILKCSKSACIRAWQRFESTGTNLDRERIGRPKKTTVQTDHRLHRLSKSNRKRTAVDICNEINKNNPVKISVHTVRRRLRKFGLFGRIARKKPFISLLNRRRRIKFANEHLHWTPQMWSNVIFSDETKINRFGSDGKQYVRRKVGEEYAPQCLTATVKGAGGSIMVWACFSRGGVGPIHRIDGILDRFGYVNILNNVLRPYAGNNWPQHIIFQQDNDPKHTSNLAKDWFAVHNVPLMNWPAQSPDLNPIENLWAIVKKHIRETEPKNLNELWAETQKAWRSIPAFQCVKLIDSMPKRCEAVLKNFGYPTKY